VSSDTKYSGRPLVGMIWMKKITLLVGFWLLSTLAMAQSGQDFQLGIQYFQQGEYEKAVTVFEELHKKEPFVNTYYVYLFNSFSQLKDYDALEKLTRAQGKRDPAVVTYKVDEAYLYKLQGNLKKAENNYQKLIKDLVANRGAIVALSNAFRSRNEFDFAIQTLLAGRRLLDSPYDFPLDLADLYAASGKKREMAQSYLEYVLVQPQQLAYVQNMLQSRLAESDYPALRDLLLEGLQQRPDEVVLSELLIWFFVQQQDFNGAFVQARALDKRNRENGVRIMELAASAIENQQFGAAAEMYRYIIDKKQDNPFYLEARFKLIQCSQAELELQPAAPRASWQELANAYRSYIQDFQLFPNLPEVKQALAAVLAFQLTEIDSAMLLLEATLELGRGDQRTLAAVKLALGDIYLIAGELWDASLMYAQVEKDFANEPLGQEAKFRNSRLSFYKGEFDWAQAQLDVLKASTTQRISNDAIALSLLITENYDTDTVTFPMEMFARGDLWAFCRQYDKALSAYDSLLRQYPGHALTDEVLYREATIYEKTGKMTEAASLYKRIVAEFGGDIYGDDALYALAKLTEDVLKDNQTAMTLYQRLLNDYPDSHFIFEARRRFRSLRGDTIN